MIEKQLHYFHEALIKSRISASDMISNLSFQSGREFAAAEKRQSFLMCDLLAELVPLNVSYACSQVNFRNSKLANRRESLSGIHISATWYIYMSMPRLCCMYAS